MTTASFELSLEKIDNCVNMTKAPFWLYVGTIARPQEEMLRRTDPFPNITKLNNKLILLFRSSEEIKIIFKNSGLHFVHT